MFSSFPQFVQNLSVDKTLLPQYIHFSMFREIFSPQWIQNLSSAKTLPPHLRQILQFLSSDFSPESKAPHFLQHLNSPLCAVPHSGHAFKASELPQSLQNLNESSCFFPHLRHITVFIQFPTINACNRTYPSIRHMLFLQHPIHAREEYYHFQPFRR